MEQKDLSISAMVGAIHHQGAILRAEGISVTRTFAASARESKTPEVGDVSGISLAYLNDEFPSQRPYVSSSVTHSLGKFFVSLLPPNDKIRAVFWALERPSMLRLWTIIDEPNIDLQKCIYEAERVFLDKIEDFMCDFSVLYSLGRPLSDLIPTGAVSVK